MPRRGRIRRNINGKGEETERGILHRCAVGFHIEIVAPAADSLRQHETGRNKVAQQERRELFDAAENQYDNQAGDDGPVNRDTALPDAEDRQGIVPEIRPGKGHIVNPRPDDSQRKHPERQIQDGILFQAGAPLLPGSEHNRKKRTENNQHAVPGQGSDDIPGGRSGKHGQNSFGRQAAFDTHDYISKPAAREGKGQKICCEEHAFLIE